MDLKRFEGFWSKGRRPLDLKGKLTYVSPDDSRIRRMVIDAMERATGKKKIQGLYDELKRMQLGPGEIWRKSIELLQVYPDFDPGQLAKIPQTGPLIIIANHPFGVVDGLMMGYLVSCIRNDFSVLVNEVLCRQDERMNPYLLPIDFQESRKAMETNIQTRKIATERLKAGQCVVIFPSGGVATAPKVFGKAEDLEWKRFTAKLIKMARATVVPIYFHGQNSRLFQAASHIHSSLRLGLLLREVRNKMGTSIPMIIGDPIPWQDLEEIKDRQVLLDHLRELTFALGERH